MRHPRTCAEPGCPRLTTTTRCPTHEAARNTSRPQYHGTWRATSRHARTVTPWCHCPGCPRCQGSPCTNRDLTLDHEHAQVECRPCNASHRHNPGDAWGGGVATQRAATPLITPIPSLDPCMKLDGADMGAV